MPEERITDRLFRGEKVLCPECGKAYIVLNSHSACCPNCDFYICLTPNIPELNE